MASPSPGPFTAALTWIVGALVALWTHLLDPLLRPLIGRWVLGRLGPSKQRTGHVDTRRPARVPEDDDTRVAVIGGGLAGLAAATVLADRGLKVTLYEARDHLGGKVGAWTEQTDDGELFVEHGFHAFFPAYHNLLRLLDHVGIGRRFQTISEYVILTADGGRMGFGGVDDRPVLNLLDLATKGLFDFREIVASQAWHELDALMLYDRDATFRDLDGVSFAAWADKASLPQRMRVVFTTFARAFFAEAEDVSMAELIKSFHAYYLSHDLGLTYTFPATNHEDALLTPFREHLEARGVDLQIGKPVDGIERQKNGRLRMRGRPYDHVVLAADVVGAQRILSGSGVAEEDAELVARLGRIQPTRSYAVWRLVLDTDLRPDLPVFVATEKRRVLDSLTAVHRIEADSRVEVPAGGSLIELHAYVVPEALEDEARLREAFLDDLHHYFPELASAAILRDHLEVRRDFAAFHVGMAAHRPGTDTGIDGLVLAGDWVAQPWPVMLMEAAATSGIAAANRVLAAQGLREEPIYTVPERGLLAPRRASGGVPRPA